MLDSLLHQKGSDFSVLIVDHSRVGDYRQLCSDFPFVYRHDPENPGYAVGNNRNFNQLGLDFKYFLVLNPDVILHRDCLGKMLGFFEERSDVDLVVPRVLDGGGELQHLCHRLPRPMDLILRRFFRRLPYLLNQHRARYEYREMDHTESFRVETASGSCLCVRSEVYEKLKGFDERFFLYMEDVDFSRRLGEIGVLQYLPEAKITHHHARASYHSYEFLFQHCVSAVQYYNKWGWWPLI